MAGVDLRTVAELLGHRTRYSHFAPEHQALAVDRLVKVGKRRDNKSDNQRFQDESDHVKISQVTDI
jgi:hypothetical protein